MTRLDLLDDRFVIRNEGWRRLLTVVGNVTVRYEAIASIEIGLHELPGVLTPKAGREGHVEPSEVAESAPTAGLQQTSTVNAGRDWSGARLVLRRGSKGKK